MHRIKLYPVNLRLFDGEGGGTGEGAGTDGNAASSSAAESSETVVVYGKDTGDSGAGTGTDDANKGSDTQNQDTLSFDFKKLTTPEARKEAFKQVRERFKDEFTDHFQQQFNQRFKGQKETEARLSKAEPILDTLQKYFGVSNLDELASKVDEDILADVAEKEGFTDPKKYREHVELQKKEQRRSQEDQDREREDNSRKLVEKWQTQATELDKELKKAGGSFNLSEELKNEAFTKKLSSGMDVSDAYYLVHRNDDIKKAADAAAKAAEKNTVDNIRAKGNRIQENGTNRSPSVVRKSDPSKLTDADMEEIAERVRRGEKITF